LKNSQKILILTIRRIKSAFTVYTEFHPYPLGVLQKIHKIIFRQKEKSPKNKGFSDFLGLLNFFKNLVAEGVRLFGTAEFLAFFLVEFALIT